MRSVWDNAPDKVATRCDRLVSFGLIVHTQFLLQYISEIELRESGHAATCKSEEFSQFVQWVFVYDNGMIQENLRYAQDKMAGVKSRRRGSSQLVSLLNKAHKSVAYLFAQDSESARHTQFQADVAICCM